MEGEKRGANLRKAENRDNVRFKNSVGNVESGKIMSNVILTQAEVSPIKCAVRESAVRMANS